MSDYVIGVDGGNSKTDVVIAATSGRLLARQRGPGVQSPLVDTAAWRDGIAALVDETRRQARVPARSKALCAVYFLANVDLPAERRIARHELADPRQAEQTVVQNDTLAVLRAGARRSWGVSVVAGAGINAVGVHPSGRIARFLALGDYSGDAGGGHDIGVRGLGAAVRAQDGRGPSTALKASIPKYFGLKKPQEVAIAVHRGAIRHDDLRLLAPLVFAAAADGDQAASSIIAAFADEIAVMAVALIRRLHLTRTDVEVILGGGTVQTGDGALFSRVVTAITAQVPRAQVSVLDVAPVYGAVVEAFGRLGVNESSLLKLRKALETKEEALPQPIPST